MTGRVPLAVRLTTSRGSMDITRQIRNLRSRWVIPGGYLWAQVDLDRDLALQPDEIAHYGRLTVTDAGHGGVVWDGRVEELGRAVDGGQVWRLGAVGLSAHATDRRVPIVYVDKPLDQLHRVNNVTLDAVDQIGEDPGGSGSPAAVLRFPHGLAVTTSSSVTLRYRALTQARLGVTSPAWDLARISATWDAGRTDSNFDAEVHTRSSELGSPTTVFTATLSTGGGTVAVTVGTIPSDHNVVDLHLDCNTTGTIGASDETHWLSFRDLVVRTVLVDRTGTEITTGYTLDTVYAHEVVTDLLGRLLPHWDAANATIATTSQLIDRLAYYEPVHPATVLSELMTFEPDFYWAVWERNRATGLYRFEWRTWPTAVRYELALDDGYDGPSSAAGLFNAVQVFGRDATGELRSVRATTPNVAELEAAGLVREESIDLGSETYSDDNADRVGNDWLAARVVTPIGGRLRVARPVLDRLTGRMVQPYEIRPGLARIRGLRPRPGTLTATDRDGVAVTQLVGGEYDLASGSVTLDLDVPRVLSPQSLVRALQNSRTRR